MLKVIFRSHFSTSDITEQQKVSQVDVKGNAALVNTGAT